MTRNRISLIVIGFILMMVPFIAFAAHTACGSPEDAAQRKSVEKVCVVSKDDCKMAAPASSDKMPGCETMGSCRRGMQLCKRICTQTGPMHRQMLIGGAGAMMESCEGPHGGGSCIQDILAMDKELALTDAQKYQLGEISHAVTLAMLDLETTLAKEQITLEKLLGDEAGLEEVAKQLENVKDAEYDLKLKEITSKREAMEILTKEQKETLKAHVHRTLQTLELMGIDESSCPGQMEVEVQEGGKPGERKVIIIREPDKEDDD